MTRYLLLLDWYGLVSVGCPLWREDGSVFFRCYWPLPAQSFSGPSPLWLATVFYCVEWTIDGFSVYSLRLDNTENTSVTWQWIYVNNIENISCDTGSIVVFTAPSNRNGSYQIFACLFVAAGMCLLSHCLETGLHVTICGVNNFSCITIISVNLEIPRPLLNLKFHYSIHRSQSLHSV
jgi:hypothetical protein